MSTNDTAAPKTDAGDKVCSILESIAKNYAPDSDEAIAIRDAALAFTVVQQHKALKTQYSRLRRGIDGQISEEMKAKLRRRGIEPTDLEE